MTDEQILQAKRNIKSDLFYESECLDANKAILASLEELKRIHEVQVPDEPAPSGCDFNAWQEYSATLRDLLRRTQNSDEHNFERWQAAESKLAAIENDRICPMCDKMMEELK